MSDADIIAIGSGHNGLVAAAYCAVAGRKVLVLERNPWFGGGVVTRELTQPGFWHDQHSMSHIFIQGNPLLLNDELGLKSRYGLEYLFPEKPMMSIFEGETLSLYRDNARSVAEVEKFSARDAKTFADMSRQAAEWLPMIMGSLYSPPMPVGASHAMLDQSREGRAVWKIMQMSSHDVLTDLFESDEVRMHFRAGGGRESRLPGREGDRHRRLCVPGLPREVRLRRAGRRIGRADGRAHSLHQGSWRAGDRQCAGARSDDERRAGHWRRARRRHTLWREGRHHRRHPPPICCRPSSPIWSRRPHGMPPIRSSPMPPASLSMPRSPSHSSSGAEGADAVMVELMPDSYEDACAAASTNCATASSCRFRWSAWARSRSSIPAACRRAGRFSTPGTMCPSRGRTGSIGTTPRANMPSA